MKKIRIYILSLLSVILIFNSCTGKDEAKTTEDKANKPIYFAWYGPLTGDAKQYGDTEKIAVELALKDINDAGNGVLGGRKIIVDFYDDKNDAKEAVNIANKIVAEKKYLAVVGGFGSTPSMAAAPIYEKAKIINYSPTSSHADFSSLGKFMFRNTPTQQIETTQYADYVYKKLGIKSVAILNVNDDWGNNIAKIFTNEFVKLGGKITDLQTYIPNQTSDFTPMISKAKTTNPEAFFPVAYYQDSANIVRQAKNLDFNVQMILSSSTLKQELIDLAGDIVEGSFIMNAYSPDINTPEFIRVIGEYTKRTGKQGDAFVMQTYDVVKQLATAVDMAGSDDPVVVRETLANMKGYNALSGPYDMNELGDAVRSLVPMFIKNGKFTRIDD
ncbi:ABC transporter substrate-binding protein [Treponema putidum]|uniref:Leucine-binding protein domain-containing protein n=1 Tax=Treponema putidum TaxID=221027 RepID=A0ABY5HRV5_9SPIR|nr:ABC transporter substrate-binding protein [Treponema putidum]AIN94150.1 hypothetical protein JO40_08580 [Treponema putidum]TWI79611.1 amino acid/amide ABC transporter substrate-binding protein (HAAT family) [Treponema putidum]UTY28099.1 hypothetical protein E4N76_03230 [Treponema putidum]UTY30598.1 hypothetical protein E4N75_02830 [Treponema putidum]